MDARLILNEEKTIRGMVYKRGAVVAEVQCVNKITVDDLNRGLQLAQISIVSDKKEEKKPDPVKPENGKPQGKK